MKIALVGERYGTNNGEPLLFYATEHVLNRISDEKLEFVHIDFFGRTKRVVPKVEVSKPAPIVNTYSLAQRRLYHWYYLRLFKDVDLVLIMGAGTLKWHVRLDFGPRYQAVLEAAKWYGIPCVVSCVGVESPYVESDRRCRRFARILSDSGFKIITTRDDLSTLRQYVKNPETEVARIADVGVWASETYSIKKDAMSDVVGLGIICYRRFAEYSRNISKEDYESTIADIIHVFETRGTKWKFFCNGDAEDVAYEKDLCGRLGYSLDDYMCKPPESPEELVRLISSFKGVITSRLHSCIVSYSLKIPFVAIVWNEKLNFFAKDIGYPERAINKDRLSADTIISVFDKAVTQGYDERCYAEYRNTTIAYFQKYLGLMGVRSRRGIYAVCKELIYRFLLSFGRVTAVVYRFRKRHGWV